MVASLSLPLRKEKVSDEEIQFLASMILSHLLCHLAVSFSRSLVKIKKNSSLFQRAIHMLGWGGWNISEYCCKFLKNNNKNCKILRIFPAKVSHGFISCFGLSQAIVFGLFSLL